MRMILFEFFTVDVAVWAAVCLTTNHGRVSFLMATYSVGSLHEDSTSVIVIDISHQKYPIVHIPKAPSLWCMILYLYWKCRDYLFPYFLLPTVFKVVLGQTAVMLATGRMLYFFLVSRLCDAVATQKHCSLDEHQSFGCK